MRGKHHERNHLAACRQNPWPMGQKLFPILREGTQVGLGLRVPPITASPSHTILLVLPPHSLPKQPRILPPNGTISIFSVSAFLDKRINRVYHLLSISAIRTRCQGHSLPAPELHRRKKTVPTDTSNTYVQQSNGQIWWHMQGFLGDTSWRCWNL